MSAITTHVLDTAAGRPASGVEVTLERQAGSDAWEVIGRGVTDADGRLRSLMADAAGARPGVYRLVFQTEPYFAARGMPAFHPYVAIAFVVADDRAHYHVPLLLSPYGYTTYRGS